MSRSLEVDLVLRLRDLAGNSLDKFHRDLQTQLKATKKDADAAAGATDAIGRGDGVGRLASALSRVRDAAHGVRAAMEGMLDVGRRLGQITAPIAAAGYVLSKPMGATMDYGMRLAQMANTAFSDRDTAGRIAGKAELDAAIVAAVRAGGGTREGAATALDTLIASGAMSGKDAMALLPTLVRASSASGADPNQLAAIGIRGMQTFGLGRDQVGRVLDMAITAGQAGGFELKDMARWLPQQMAAARLSGMTGIEGMAKLLAANQASAITAGTKDEAGNNLVNLLAKINSQDTAKDADKLGINLSGALADARGKGFDSLDAFIGIVDGVVAKDQDFQRLRAQLKTATGAERVSMLSSQADILEGSSIGRIVQDRQALMGLIGVMANRDYMADVQRKALAGGGATDRNFGVIAAEAGFQTQRAREEATVATYNAFDKLSPTVAKVAEGMAKFAKEFPILSSAIAASVAILTALIAASGAGGIAALLGGKGAAGAAAGAAGGAAGMAGKVAKGAGVLGAGVVGWELGSMIYGWLESKGVTGASVYELFHGTSAEKQKAVRVEVDVKNGNIAASVNQGNERDARRR